MAGYLLVGGAVVLALAARRSSFYYADNIIKGHDLSGKNAIVTGSNTGIGLETAAVLAQAGCHVFMGCRDTKKAEKAVEAIRSRYPTKKLELTVLELDLADFKSVYNCAEEFKRLNIPLHYLILNAGMWGSPTPRKPSVDGIDAVFAANHFGHFALTQLLLPILQSTTKKSSSPARVVVVSSNSHRRWNKPLPLAGYWSAKTDEYNRPALYAQTKLANVQFTRELHRRYGKEIDAFSLHPGTMVGTDIGRGVPGGVIAMQGLRFWTPTINQGAATSIYCAVDEKLTGKGGGYYSNCKEETPIAAALDAEASRKLWDESEDLYQRLLAKIAPRSSSPDRE